MRLAVLADTHLRSAGLPPRCRQLAADADVVIHAGDVASVAALDELEALSQRLVAVHGNVDGDEVAERLPAAVTVELGGVEIGVIHDAGPERGRLARLRDRFPDADAVVFGHSHRPFHETAEGFQIFNPGSPTQRRRAPAHTIGRATIEAGLIRFEHVTLP